jgi:hypothetical protein
MCMGFINGVDLKHLLSGVGFAACFSCISPLELITQYPWAGWLIICWIEVGVPVMIPSDWIRDVILTTVPSEIMVLKIPYIIQASNH